VYLPAKSTSKLLILLSGLILLIAPIMRFSWDYQAQVILCLIILFLFFLFVNKNEFSFSLKKEGLLSVFFLSLLLSCNKVQELSIYRNELIMMFFALVLTDLFGRLPAAKIKEILLAPIFVGLWLSIILIATFIVHPLKYYIDTIVLVNINIAAAYLALCFAVSFIYWDGYNKKLRIISAALFAAVILTQSRAAIVVSTAIFIYYLQAYYKDYLKWLKYLAFMVIAALSYITFLKVRSSQNSQYIYYFSDRFMWWKTALYIFSDNWLTGSGWHSFGSLYPLYAVKQGLNTIYVHNIIFQMLSEIGLLGFLVFMSLIASAGRNIKKLTGTDKSFYLPLYFGIISFLIINMFDYSFYVYGVSLFFWAIFGVVYNENKELVERDLTSIQKGYVYVAVLIMASIIIYPFCANLEYLRGVKFFKANQLDLAEKKLISASIIDPLSSEYYGKLSELYYYKYLEKHDVKYIKRSIEEQKNAIEHFKTNSVYWSDLAWLYWSSGQKESALNSILNALKYDKFNTKYQKTLKYFMEPVSYVK
jgi:O-antigen ligase